MANISTENVLPVARAFSQFLNLTNIAEQYQTISRHHQDASLGNRSLGALFARLKAQIHRLKPSSKPLRNYWLNWC
ncbi:phosphoenolpyruvate carboxylase [Actinobacillus equuli]|nr:phosphoenolpyruvate carboxylase [Actinobacillus equuli]